MYLEIIKIFFKAARRNLQNGYQKIILETLFTLRNQIEWSPRKLRGGGKREVLSTFQVVGIKSRLAIPNFKNSLRVQC